MYIVLKCHVCIFARASDWKHLEPVFFFCLLNVVTHLGASSPLDSGHTVMSNYPP